MNRRNVATMGPTQRRFAVFDVPTAFAPERPSTDMHKKNRDACESIPIVRKSLFGLFLEVDLVGANIAVERFVEYFDTYIVLQRDVDLLGFYLIRYVRYVFVRFGVVVRIVVQLEVEIPVVLVERLKYAFVILFRIVYQSDRVLRVVGCAPLEVNLEIHEIAGVVTLHYIDLGFVVAYLSEFMIVNVAYGVYRHAVNGRDGDYRIESRFRLILLDGVVDYGARFVVDGRLEGYGRGVGDECGFAVVEHDIEIACHIRSLYHADEARVHLFVGLGCAR